MAWDSSKTSTSLILSADWNDFVTNYKAHRDDTSDPHSTTLTQTNLIISGVSGNTLIVNTTTLVVDATNGYVGIGTASPSAKLHTVKGTAATLPTLDGGTVAIFENTASSSVLQLFSSNTTYGIINFGDPESRTSGQIAYNHNTNYLAFTTNTSERMRIDSSGNVGIGTTTPAKALEVKTAGATNGSLTFYSSAYGGVIGTTAGSVQGDLYFAPVNGRLVFGDGVTTSNSLNIYEGATKVVYITSNTTSYFNAGNVGIGTTSPGTDSANSYTGTKLEISGASTSRGVLDLGQASTTDGSSIGILGFLNKQNGDTTGATRKTIAYIAGNVETTDSNADLDSGGHLDFWTKPEAGVLTQRMRIDSVGNFGIGTASPDGKFHVMTATAGTVTAHASYDDIIAEGTTAVGIGILSQDNGVTGIGFGTPSDNLGAYLQWDYTNSLMSIGTAKASSALRFMVADNTEKVRIDSAGKVGIGTTAPTVILEVKSAGAADVFKITASDGGSIFEVTEAADTSGYLGVKDASEVRKVLLQSVGVSYFNGGNLGIGDSTPSYLLELSTDSAGKPGVGGLWTVVSDEKIKTGIQLADLDRCYDIVKSVPLKRFGWADGIYSEKQVKDRHSIGWVAQDVQKVFPKSVSKVPFKKAEIPDGEEEYQVQDFITENVEEKREVIEIIDGKPVQMVKTVITEKKTMLFDEMNVVDECGNPVMTTKVISPAYTIPAEMDADGNVINEGQTIPEVTEQVHLTYPVPRMITKKRNKFKRDVIEDCLDVNNGQMIMAMYGALQKVIQKVENIEKGIGK